MSRYTRLKLFFISGVITMLLFSMGCGNETPIGFDWDSAEFEGITVTDIVGNVISEDSGDWCSRLKVDRCSVWPAYPNPTSTQINIRFGIDTPCDVTMKILDETGEIICLLADGFRAAGVHILVWDLRNDNGQRVDTNFYRCIFDAKNEYYHFQCYGDIQVR